MIKVVQFIHGMCMGGAETLVKEYCLKLDKTKFEVVLLCLNRCNTPYEEILEKENIKIIYVDDFFSDKIRKGKNIFCKVFRRFLYFKNIKKIIENEKPDIIHTHLTLNKFLLFVKFSKKIKIFHTVHTEPKLLWTNGFDEYIDKLSLKILKRKYFLRFITLHKEMNNEVNNIFNVSNSIVLNNGIDFDKFKGVQTKTQIRIEEKIPNDAFVVGNIGRLSNAKNQLFLIDVFEEIYAKNNNAFLIIVGKGILRKKIEEKIRNKGLEKRCLILEERTDVPRLMKIMDVFVFPSLYEGLGIVLIEAQKSKIPCIVSDKIPDNAIISNLVKKVNLKDSIEKWTDEIINFSIDDIRYTNLEDWNINNVINKLERIYEDKI